MAGSGALSQQNADTSVMSQEEDNSRQLTPVSDAPPAAMQFPQSPTLRPPPPPRTRASLSVNITGSPSAHGPQEGQSSATLHSRRVRFNPQVRRSTDLEENSPINSSINTSPFKTPPIAITPPDEDSEEFAGSYFDPQHGQGTPDEEDDISTPLPSPLPRTKRRTSKQITFEEEVRAALEEMPGKKLEGMSSEEKRNLMVMLGSYSAPVSAHTSPICSPRNSFEIGVRGGAAPGLDGVLDKPTLEEKGVPTDSAIPDEPKDKGTRPTATTEAHKLVRAHTQRSNFRWERKKSARDLESGASTPAEGENGPNHEQIRAGVLSSLLKLYNQQNAMPHDQGHSAPVSPNVSGKTTPKWYSKSANSSVTSLLNLGFMGSSQTLMAAGTPSGSRSGSPTGSRTPKHKKRHSGGLTNMFNKKNASKSNIADEIRITIHIAKLLSRQKYVLKLCRALMLYGVSFSNNSFF